MVLLSRIYTKTGDKGTTALGDGRRVAKDHRRVEAFGTVDELNAALGLAIAAGLDLEGADLLKRIQNDLFDVGADLCVPEKRGNGGKTARRALRITAAHVRPLEEAIDRFNGGLRPLRSFVLPGGSPASAWLHLARTVCRRAERRVVALERQDRVNPRVIIYLNRLSDLLFVMARRANDGGRADVLWVPGGDTDTKT
ncbi:MAG TPA: cob(I)yrinic acid a,c-diamide adenosyltransferase [Candidatus Polarisedimenticolia bacterium]|jgi:cob(I)alamin adenosyltransferase|nr:cob(I)yrinic acid a,c-diamide adenosyltransferase [Candidatus Polarisedimenticolia bacterium]